MKTYDYNGAKVYLQKEEYRNNGTLAVLMYKEDGELYGCITVNLNHPLQSDTLAFLDENNMPAYSHTSDDVPENVDPRQVSNVVRIVTELIRRS